MSDLPAPAAPRLARARWLDTRLLLGLVLVLVSVVVGARVVAGADRTAPVWAASSDLAPGAVLGSDDVRPVRVHLTDPQLYLRADADPPVGYQVTRRVAAGELLPAAALAPVGSQDVRRVSVEVDAATVAGLSANDVVDVYAVDRAEAGAPPQDPRLVLEKVTIASVEDKAAGFGGAGGTRAVALWVRRDAVPALLAAVSRGHAYLVEVPLRPPSAAALAPVPATTTLPASAGARSAEPATGTRSAPGGGPAAPSPSAPTSGAATSGAAR